MKKDFETYLHDVGQQVSMTSLEKEAIFANLKKVMESSSRPVTSPYASFSFFGYQRIAGLAFVVLFLVGGVTSASAEYSFPGDVLYPFKVGVNEEVRGWFSKTPIAKAEWSIRLAERRLYELESIREHVILSPEMQRSLEDKFALQVEQAEQNTRKYESELEDSEISGTLEQATLMTSSEASQEASLTTRSIAPEAASTFMKAEEKVSDSELDIRIEKSKERDDARILAQVEDLKERIRTLRKTLRNAKAMESLDRGKVLRLEARLLQSQKTLISLENGDPAELEKKIGSITKSVFDIERSLDAMIPLTEDSTAGKVLGGSVEAEVKETDSSQKEKNREDVKESSVISPEHSIETLEDTLEIRGR